MLSIPINEIEAVRTYRVGFYGHGIEVKRAGKAFKFRVSDGIFLWNSGRTALKWLAALEGRRASSSAS
jgi:hypothetical protein